MSLADRVRAARDFDARRFLPFHVAHAHCGWIRPAFARQLARWPSVFTVSDDAVALADELDSPEKRSAAVAPVLLALRGEGLLAGWRDEPYPVAGGFGDSPLLTLERAAARAFGIRTRGAHLNGFVGRGEDCRMWIARRAATKPIDPSMLDNLVGGGIGVGFGPQQTLTKECAEEAGIPAALAERVRPASSVLLLREVPEGVQWETLYAFDLELGDDFTPRNQDGEISGFCLLPIKEIRRLLRDTSDFTADAAMVIIDFMLRHNLTGAGKDECESLAAALRETPPV